MIRSWWQLPTQTTVREKPGLTEAIPSLEALIEEGYAEDQRLLVALSQVHARLWSKGRCQRLDFQGP